MKAVAILCFALAAIFLFLAGLQVITRGWRPLDLTVMDYYFVVLPGYLLMIAAGLVITGLAATFAPHP